MKKAPAKLPHLFLRKGTYIYRRSIPPGLRKLAGQSEFKVSLKTDLWNYAIVRYAEIHSEVNAKLEQLYEGKPLHRKNPTSLAAARRIATSFNLPYKSLRELIETNSPDEMMVRLNLHEKNGSNGGDTFHALFGTLENEVSLDDVLAFHEDDKRAELVGLSDREKRKKLNPVRLAVRRFNEFHVTSDYKAITRPIALAYKSHLTDLVTSGVIKPGTANKQMMHVRKIISFYNEQHALDLPNPFGKLNLHELKESRLAYSVEFV
jgi:hypothetical protein